MNQNLTTQIIELFSFPKNLTISEIAEKLKVDRKTILKILNNL
jgi:predicted transcriptional regulator